MLHRSLGPLNLSIPPSSPPCFAADAGLQHSAAVTARGAVWTWGSNRHGRLGIGVAAPVSIVGSPTVTPGRTQLSAGTDRDPLPNTAAMLAHVHHSPHGLHDDVKQGLTFPPTRAKFPPGVAVRAVACGYRHTLALAADGGVWAWGSNANQSLGLADFADRPAPVRVPGLPACSSVSAATVSAAVSCEGQLFLWGSDSYLNPWAHRNRVGGPQSTAMTPRSASLPVIHRCGFEWRWWCGRRRGGARRSCDSASTLLIPRPSLPSALLSCSGPLCLRVVAAFRVLLSLVQLPRPGPYVVGPRPPFLRRVRWLGPQRFRSVSVGARHAVAVSSFSHMYYWGDEEMLPATMQYGATR